MAKFKKGDFVVWKHHREGVPLIYSTVESVLDLPAIEEPYYICVCEMTCNGKPFCEHYEFWEHELELIDMKGANI